MNARRDLYAALMAGGPHSPDRSEKASKLIDAYRVEALTKAGVEYEDCDVCGAARGVGKPCNTCAFKARIAAELAEREEATTAAATATPDGFFQPGHTYTRDHHGWPIHFLVKNISTAPDGSSRTASGWRLIDGSWEPTDSDDTTGWTDVTGAGDGS